MFTRYRLYRRLRLALLGTAVAVLLVSPGAASVRAQTATEIIAASDKVRNPGQPFRLTNTLTEYRSGKAINRIALIVFAKEDRETGQFRNLIRYAEPPRDAGKLILKIANAMWFYDPASKSSVRLSLQQRLVGQASNGDAVTVNLAKDYTGKVLGAETIQDAERKSRSCWHLDMNAATADATYFRIETWIEKGTYYPIKSKLYSDSGRLLKILYYRKFEPQLGATRPTEAIIIDALDSELITLMAFADYRFRDIPESWFQREYLPRLSTE